MRMVKYGAGQEYNPSGDTYNAHKGSQTMGSMTNAVMQKGQGNDNPYQGFLDAAMSWGGGQQPGMPTGSFGMNPAQPTGQIPGGGPVQSMPVPGNVLPGPSTMQPPGGPQFQNTRGNVDPRAGMFPGAFPGGPQFRDTKGRLGIDRGFNMEIPQPPQRIEGTVDESGQFPAQPRYGSLGENWDNQRISGTVDESGQFPPGRGRPIRNPGGGPGEQGNDWVGTIRPPETPGEQGKDWVGTIRNPPGAIDPEPQFRDTRGVGPDPRYAGFLDAINGGQGGGDPQFRDTRGRVGPDGPAVGAGGPVASPGGPGGGGGQTAPMNPNTGMPYPTPGGPGGGSGGGGSASGSSQPVAPGGTPGFDPNSLQKGYMDQLRANFEDLFNRQTNQTAKNTRAQMALGNLQNSGAGVQVMGDAMANLGAQQGAQLGDYLFQGSENAQGRGLDYEKALIQQMMSKYNADRGVDSARIGANAQKAAASMGAGAQTAAAQMGLQGVLAGVERGRQGDLLDYNLGLTGIGRDIYGMNQQDRYNMMELFSRLSPEQMLGNFFGQPQIPGYMYDQPVYP